MRISDWSSDVCSSDLHGEGAARPRRIREARAGPGAEPGAVAVEGDHRPAQGGARSEEHAGGGLTAPMSVAIVEAKGLGLTFETGDGPVHALTGVDLTGEKGDFVSFLGPSGWGQTTFPPAVADLGKPPSCRIRVNSLSPEEARR